MNEKYIPLYRKYRPQILEEIVGQEHVKKALANAINLNKISHAYLFTGPRGTGKTSTARILAKSLNCVDGPTVKPCGKCASCLDIINSTPIDVIEIDAASNRSVNDAQNILEKIQYAPVNGKYKIYIIDEVHMLTVQAFNALLKTLEEPPENVVFILATTEVHKVLDTIKSRCQRFDFKRITTDDIAKHLKHIAELENIKIEDDAIMTIAKNSAGGMRDSLALLDQLSVLDIDHAITTDDINSLLGRISFEVLNNLTDALVNSKSDVAIEILENIYNSGNEPSQILLNLLNYLKNLLVVKNCSSELIPELTQTTQAQLEVLKKQVENLETHQIVFLIERTSHYINELKMSTNPHLWLEVAMIDLANLTENTKLVDLQNRLLKLETGETPHVSVMSYKTPPSPVQKPSMKPAGAGISQQPVIKKIEPQTELITKTQSQQEVQTPQVQDENQIENDFSPVPMSAPKAESSNDLHNLWKTLIETVESKGVQMLLAQQAKPVKITPQEVILTANMIWVKGLNDDSRKKEIISAIDKMFGQKNSNLLIREPQPSDAKIQQEMNTSEIKHTSEIEHAPETPKQQEVQKPSEIINSEETQQKENTQEIFKPTDTPEMVEVVGTLPETESRKTTDDTALSDQAKMVKDLFDGKIVE